MRQDIKEQVYRMAQACFDEKLFAGTSGNLSVFCRQEGCVYITPSSIRYETMTADDISVIRLDGTVLDGPHKPSSEWQLHTTIYEHFSKVNAVVHTHSPYATAFAVNHMSIPSSLIETLFFLGGEIHCAEYATPGTREVGLNAIPVLQDRGGCLLNNHGVVAVGADLPQARLRAEYIEDAAKIYHLAAQIGQPTVLDKL